MEEVWNILLMLAVILALYLGFSNNVTNIKQDAKIDSLILVIDTMNLKLNDTINYIDYGNNKY